jgi:hypothetical protein
MCKNLKIILLDVFCYSFIAKEEKEDKHTCYVFVSDKLVGIFAECLNINRLIVAFYNLF